MFRVGPSFKALRGDQVSVDSYAVELSLVLIIGALARPLGRAHWFSGVKGRASLTVGLMPR